MILASDVRAFLELGLHEQGLWEVRERDPALREAAALRRLIERRIALDEVNRYRQPPPPPERVARRLAAVKARFAAAGAFTGLLAAVGFELDDLRQILRDDVRIEAYVTERFGGPGRLTEAELVADWIAGLSRRADVMRVDR